jgi:septal ring factor EnvC (AmiA/AmiB activator)
VRGASLLSQKKSYFQRHPYLIMALLCCLFSISSYAEEEINLEAQLEEANRVIEEEKQKHQELSDQLQSLETEIEQLRMRAKELDEEVGDDSS